MPVAKGKREGDSSCAVAPTMPPVRPPVLAAEVPPGGLQGRHSGLLTKNVHERAVHVLGLAAEEPTTIVQTWASLVQDRRGPWLERP